VYRPPGAFDKEKMVIFRAAARFHNTLGASEGYCKGAGARLANPRQIHYNGRSAAFP
jgi:hypothetical protein